MKAKYYAKDDHNLDNRNIDPDAIFVVETLQRHGYVAYLVGGCVRDLLLGFRPKDFDVSTSAKPEEIRPLFRKCFLIGRRFRLAHVRFGRKVIEVSTFRCGDNEDDALITKDNEWGSEAEDVLRRDFTINGLFYDPLKEVLIDYVDGYPDAKKSYLRSIGNPFVRFKQDPVRMIRLLKFRARFGLDVQKESVEALFSCRTEILKSSHHRVLEELLRMLESGSSYKFFALMAEHGILQILLPKMSELLEKDENNLIYSFLKEFDRLLLTREVPRISRSILLSGLMFPSFHKHIHLLQEGKKKPLNLGEIYSEATFLVNDFFAPFLHIPKKISAKIYTIMTSQFRFTPTVKKKRISYRIPRTNDFHYGLEFFRIRSLLEPGFTKIYEEWSYYYKRHSKKK